MLVEMIDCVLDILERESAYRAFHLDSQSVVLVDYLQIRPEKKFLIKKLVEEKRLLIGPWFILPDEFLVGGENLIRNLLLGHEICKEFGGASKVGYSPFSWGQISQLPQIYHQFGIDVIMFYRGVNSLDSKKAEFIWVGADGTRKLTSRFSTMPRYNFYFYIYRPVVHNENFSDIEYKWTKGGIPFHFADKEFVDEDYFLIKPLDSYFRENIQQSVENIINDQADDFTTPHVIWMEGHDSSGPNIKTVQIIKDIKEKFPGLDVRHSTLEEYSDALKQTADISNLPIVQGERRSSQYDLRSGNLFGYTTSARMYLKQKNFQAEKWLQFYAEPLNSISCILGCSISYNYIKLAWNYLIQNSAHDSIGGCSLDEIHEDMMHRYKQCIEISKGVIDRACKRISLLIDTSKFDKFNKNKLNDNQCIYHVALNPNYHKRNEIIEGIVDVPYELKKKSIKIIDEDGNQIDLQLKKDDYIEPVLEQMIDRPMYFKMHRYNCYMELKQVPSFGFKTYQVIPTDIQKKNKLKKIGKLSNKSAMLENDFLKIKVNKNGSINVKDKINNHLFENIAYFYDEGEAGHAWVNKPIKPFISTLNERPEIKFIENGHLSSTIQIKYKWKTPYNRCITQSKPKKNKSRKVVTEIIVHITLSKLAKRLDFKVIVTNKAINHRLRIMFPSNINSAFSYGEGQFDVVERTTERIKVKSSDSKPMYSYPLHHFVELPDEAYDTSKWIEQPMYDYPMHHFVDMTDGIIGYAVLVNGLKEYEVLEDKAKTLAITLFRAFTYIIQPSSVQDYSHQDGAQCLGRQEFLLSFYPHKGNWQKGKVFEQAYNFNNELRLFQIGKTFGYLSPSLSFVKIEPSELIFSAFKKSELDNKDFILRLYNPTEKLINGSVRFFTDIEKAELVTLEELPIENIAIKNRRTLSFPLGKKKVISIRLRFHDIID
jgi:alpha-mannosidase